jgi:hypothetical protein
MKYKGVFYMKKLLILLFFVIFACSQPEQEKTVVKEIVNNVVQIGGLKVVNKIL